MTTRAEFLGRIRTELGRAPGPRDASASERPARPAELAAVSRRELGERWPETLERFRREFERVGGVFHRAPGAAAVADRVATIAAERDARRVVAWHPVALGLDVATPLGARGLACETMPAAEVETATRERLREVVAAADLGVTGADLAIAETGTLVLRSGPGRPRSTSLLPATHVAVFDREALIESLAQLGVVLEAWHAEPPGPGAGISLITGPSRTADIELTLTRGVHGPREVHVVFVDSGLRG